MLSFTICKEVKTKTQLKWPFSPISVKNKIYNFGADEDTEK